MSLRITTRASYYTHAYEIATVVHTHTHIHIHTHELSSLWYVYLTFSLRITTRASWHGSVEKHSACCIYPENCSDALCRTFIYTRVCIHTYTTRTDPHNTHAHIHTHTHTHTHILTAAYVFGELAVLTSICFS